MNKTILMPVLLVAGTGLIVSFYYQSKMNEVSYNPNSVVEENSPEDRVVENQNTTPSEPKTTPIGSSKVLDLSNQRLTKTPAYIFEKTSIEELNLSNNQLDGALPAEVRHLQNLKVLNLSNNNFTGVPAEVGQLKNLEVLDLSNNQITGMPYELGNLTKLKVLNLTGNNYSALDLDIIKKNLPASVQIITD